MDLSISMGVNADLFGVAGMSRELTLSAGYTFTYSEMKTNTSRFETSKTETTTVSVERTATVPAYTSMDAYDAVQTYRNVVVFYVQKIRVSGKRGVYRLREMKLCRNSSLTSLAGWLLRSGIRM